MTTMYMVYLENGNFLRAIDDLGDPMLIFKCPIAAREHHAEFEAGGGCGLHSVVPVEVPDTITKDGCPPGSGAVLRMDQ